MFSYLKDSIQPLLNEQFDPQTLTVPFPFLLVPYSSISLMDSMDPGDPLNGLVHSINVNGPCWRVKDQ